MKKDAEQKNLTLQQRIGMLKNSVEFGDNVADHYRAQLVQDQLREIVGILEEITKPTSGVENVPPAPKKDGGGKAKTEDKKETIAA